MKKQITGRTVLFCLLGFFGVIVGMNILMASFALNTFDGSTEPDAYRKGLDFNARIAAAQDAEALGWSLNLATDIVDLSSRTVKIEVEVDGVRAPQLIGLLWRQTADGMDVPLTFSQQLDGRYIALAQLPAWGRWELRATVEDSGKTVKFRKELVWEP